MCGIFCSIWSNNSNADHNIKDYARCKCQIERRGPDYLGERSENLSVAWKAFFASSVLWMQGPELFRQPCIDSDGNILLWNGDIFSGPLAKNNVSDTQTLQNAFQASGNIPETLKAVKGPYSIVYYQATRKILYFARDSIGRHSLLIKAYANCHRITISSSTSGDDEDYLEVPAIGIFEFEIESSTFTIHPWFRPDSRSENLIQHLEIRLGVKMTVSDPVFPEHRKKRLFLEPEPRDIDYIDRIFRSFPVTADLEISDETKRCKNIMRPEILRDLMNRLSKERVIRVRIDRLLELLKKSVEVRVEKKSNFCRNCVRLISRGEILVCKHAKLGILFSGGLDSTILAALADEFVPKDESIDLVNVAFEKAKKSKLHSSNDSRDSFNVPDRITGRQALTELQKICPWRTWNFVECNISQEELQKHRSSKIRGLVYPLSTVLDDSLGCALWFASRASGLLSSTGERYDSPSRVILLGMGADELFGGYTRHRTTLRRSGWSELSIELDVELARISERNLGRDDRIVSDHGRQSRLPYLDEDFVEYASSLNAWERCHPTAIMPPGVGDKLLLRLVAHRIGLHETANFPKRAFQFGSRIANSKNNAKDASNWR